MAASLLSLCRPIDAPRLIGGLDGRRQDSSPRSPGEAALIDCLPLTLAAEPHFPSLAVFPHGSADSVMCAGFSSSLATLAAGTYGLTVGLTDTSNGTSINVSLEVLTPAPNDSVEGASTIAVPFGSLLPGRWVVRSNSRRHLRAPGRDGTRSRDVLPFDCYEPAPPEMDLSVSPRQPGSGETVYAGFQMNDNGCSRVASCSFDFGDGSPLVESTDCVMATFPHTCAADASTPSRRGPQPETVVQPMTP